MSNSERTFAKQKIDKDVHWLKSHVLAYLCLLILNLPRVFYMFVLYFSTQSHTPSMAPHVFLHCICLCQLIVLFFPVFLIFKYLFVPIYIHYCLFYRQKIKEKRKAEINPSNSVDSSSKTLYFCFSTCADRIKEKDTQLAEEKRKKEKFAEILQPHQEIYSNPMRSTRIKKSRMRTKSTKKKKSTKKRVQKKQVR